MDAKEAINNNGVLPFSHMTETEVEEKAAAQKAHREQLPRERKRGMFITVRGEKCTGRCQNEVSSAMQEMLVHGCRHIFLEGGMETDLNAFH